MRQVIPNQLLSYQQRHRCGKQSLLHALQISDEQPLPRERWHELQATFRCNQLVQKSQHQLGRRLSDRYEYRCHQEEQIKEQKLWQRKLRGF